MIGFVNAFWVLGLMVLLLVPLPVYHAASQPGRSQGWSDRTLIAGECILIARFGDRLLLAPRCNQRDVVMLLLCSAETLNVGDY